MIKSMRIAKGMTQERIAELAGISREAYTNIENGKRKPSVKTAKKIANVLGIQWSNFFDTENNAKSNTPN